MDYIVRCEKCGNKFMCRLDDIKIDVNCTYGNTKLVACKHCGNLHKISVTLEEKQQKKRERWYYEYNLHGKR